MRSVVREVSQANLATLKRALKHLLRHADDYPYVREVAHLIIHRFRNPSSLLHTVVTESEEWTRELLVRGADPNVVNRNGDTPLLEVVMGNIVSYRGGEDEVLPLVELLLDYGADVDAQNRDGQTALHGAAEDEYHDTITLLIERGASLEIKDDLGNTALNAAGTLIAHDTITILVENGANVNTQNRLGMTKLMSEANSRSRRNVRFLLEHGADPNLRDVQGRTARDWVQEPYHGWGEDWPTQPVLQLLEDAQARYGLRPFLAEALRRNPRNMNDVQQLAQNPRNMNAVQRVAQNPLFDPRVLDLVGGYLRIPRIPHQDEDMDDAD